MNVILLTVLALGGTGGEIATTGEWGDSYAECENCAPGPGHHLPGSKLHGHCMGPMPQTCYEPPYGCYHGSRWNNRYPAFHGTYYRKAYNYRNYFDYPWHAEMHEPTSQWSYHVTGDTAEPSQLPIVPPDVEKQAPPPVPTPASYEIPLMEEVRSALSGEARAKSPGNPLRVLRW